MNVLPQGIVEKHKRGPPALMPLNEGGDAFPERVNAKLAMKV
jgi:hypothetical protein